MTHDEALKIRSEILNNTCNKDSKYFGFIHHYLASGSSYEQYMFVHNSILDQSTHLAITICLFSKTKEWTMNVGVKMVHVDDLLDTIELSACGLSFIDYIELKQEAIDIATKRGWL